MSNRTEDAAWLRRVLRWNSGFSMLSGMTLAVAVTPLARVLTPQMTTVFRVALSHCYESFYPVTRL
jgi:hypothetical protein